MAEQRWINILFCTLKLKLLKAEEAKGKPDLESESLRRQNLWANCLRLSWIRHRGSLRRPNLNWKIFWQLELLKIWYISLTKRPVANSRLLKMLSELCNTSICQNSGTLWNGSTGSHPHTRAWVHNKHSCTQWQDNRWEMTSTNRCTFKSTALRLTSLRTSCQLELRAACPTTHKSSSSSNLDQ